jgi:hypothetical protein
MIHMISTYIYRYMYIYNMFAIVWKFGMRGRREKKRGRSEQYQNTLH